MPHLFLVRHAEPERRGVFLGQLDPPLSNVGLLQAQTTLAEIMVEVVYSSPLQRARQTASCLRALRRVELEALREIDYGTWTGKSWSEIETDWNDLAIRKSSDWLGVAPPGGEGWPEFVVRVNRAWEIIRNGPSPAAVVAHQGVNAALVHILKRKNPLEFTQQHGEVIRVDYD